MSVPAGLKRWAIYRYPGFQDMINGEQIHFLNSLEEAQQYVKELVDFNYHHFNNPKMYPSLNDFAIDFQGEPTNNKPVLFKLPIEPTAGKNLQVRIAQHGMWQMYARLNKTAGEYATNDQSTYCKVIN